MGMITRVRARLQSLSLGSRIQGSVDFKPTHDDRNTKTMCVLSAILLVPCFARLPSTFLISCVGVAYFVVVLPMLLSGGSLHLWVERASCYLTLAHGVLIRAVEQIFSMFRRFLNVKSRLELAFLRMGNLASLLNQMLFFTLCDRCFCSEQRLTCFYSLMFYNVIAYCVGYVHQLTTEEDWSPYVRISRSTNVKHLAMTTTKIVLELTKAITFIITVVFMLLAFGLEQGLEHYHPTKPYLAITGLYYLLTEKTFSWAFHALLELIDLEILEGLEKLWAPVIVKASICVLSGLLALPAAVFGGFWFAAFAAYVNVYLAYRDLVTTAWASLRNECNALAKYRYATGQEVKDIDDVCAVCLQSMRFARVTPCHHMFHGDCLRLCLKECNTCPMCKRELA